MSELQSAKLIRKLVSFDTTSLTSNMELIEYVQTYLKDYDVNSELTCSDDGTRANLYATVGPSDRPGVMLSGHTDVVPVAGQVWETNPYQVIEKDNKLFGRGTADMKSFIACVLAHLPFIQQDKLHTPLHLAFSYDEEIGCIGVRRLLDVMQDMPIKPAMCIVGEPTCMKVVTAHKGKLAKRVVVRGLESHSGLPHLGVNAIDYAAELICFIKRLGRELAENGPFEEGFEIRHTTLHTGTVKGGTALNIVPKQCEFEFEIRNIPKHDPLSLLENIIAFAKEQLEPEMQAIDSECGINFESISDYPGMFTPADAQVVKFVQQLAKVETTEKITFGTEGGLFTEHLKIPTVVCGPGSITQAHKPNEFIMIEQIQHMEAFMNRLVEAMSV